MGVINTCSRVKSSDTYLTLVDSALKKVNDAFTPLAAGEVTWDPPHYAAGAWHETESPAGTANPGKVFYHNSVTGEVQWAKPEVTAWIKYHEDL